MDQRGKSRGNFRGNFKKGRGRGGRGNNHGRGRGRGRGGSFRGNNHRSNGNYSRDNQSLYKPEQLAETEAGITEYISTLDGFKAVIRSRYSDFHVNEIDLDGNVAKLTDTKIPEEFKVIRVEIPEESPLPSISQEQWQEIKTLIETGDDSEFVNINVTSIDKETRSTIHKTLKSIFHTRIISNTKEEDDKKFIHIKRKTGKNKQERSDQWPAQLPIYTHFLLYKESIDTMNAIMGISDALRMNSSAFNYAGVKDRRAKTTQWISCKKIEPSKLLFRTKRLRNIKIGNIKFKDEPLKLGQLSGNYFRLALREITVDDEVVNAHLEHIKEHGFINYYGLQRFGNDKTVPTHLIGIKLLQGNFREACSLILKPKDYDNPLAEITQAKKIYAETQNAQDALQKLSSNQSIESKLIHGLAKFGKNDFVNALECIPRNMRLMYIHAFQSLIWNQVASKRVKDFGLKPVVGDLVYLTDQEENEFLLDDTKGLKDDESEVTEENEKDVEAEVKKQLVKVLSEEDLSNYTIYDVVLPMPGYDVTYPENLKDYYVELLGKHKLELEMPKQRVKCYTLSGTYRKIVSKPEELAWHTIKYNDPIDTLIRSDFEEILGHKEPVNNPDGKFKGLVVSFKLKSSSYATMVLREILKIDTATINPSKFQQNTPKVDKTGTDTVAAEAEGSLMQDKDKYDAFKRLIEGDGDDDEEEIVCMKRPAEDVEVPSKKAKVDEDSDDDTGIKMQPSLV